MGFLQKYFKNSKVTQKSEVKVTIQNHNSRFLISRTEEIGENTQNKKTVFFQYYEKLSKLIREMLLTT